MQQRDDPEQTAGTSPQWPASIGPYRILGLLGEGGMGRVYLAQESHPEREVALKVVRGLTRGTLARFQREVGLLAQLEHPGIARLYAAGEDLVGGVATPWLAMERVRGQGLRDWARQQQPDRPTLIALLIAIGRAVQHAHAHGVVHRDLKPGNILVDADARPHVLDFGVARLLEDEAGMTRTGQIVGTLPYMSPEQLSGRAVDARSDVYALGAIAYELISGQLPHPRLSTSSLFEALEIVQRDEPAALARLQPQARGDLNRVVMKALASDPALRYPDAGAFADDLQRLLEHRPVQARAPGAAYRLRRFVRRNRALSTAVLVVFLALAGTALVSTRAAQKARAAQAVAELRAQEAAAINTFLETMLTSVTPEQAQGHEVRVSEVLDESERELASLKAPPTVRLSLASTLAGTRLALGQYRRGLALNQTALDLIAEALPRAALHGKLLRQRATLLTELARFDEAGEALAQARPLLRDAGPALRIGLELTAARLEHEAGRPEAALDGYREVLAAALAAEPGDPELERLIDMARSNLALALTEQGRLDEAEALARQVLEARLAKHGERDPRTLASRRKLALLFAARGDHAATEAEARATLALQTEVLGSDGIDTLMSQQILGNALLQQGRLEEAEPHLRIALVGFERQLGADHGQTVAALSSLAYLLEERRQWDEAEALYQRILATQSSNPAATLAPRNNLAMLLLERGRPEAALEEFERLLATTREITGEEHAFYLIFSSNRGLALLRAGRPDEARRVLEPVLDALRKNMGDDHPRSRTAAERLAEAYRALGREQAARELLEALP